MCLLNLKPSLPEEEKTIPSEIGRSDPQLIQMVFTIVGPSFMIMLDKLKTNYKFCKKEKSIIYYKISIKCKYRYLF